LQLRFSGGPLSNVDFEKWAYVAALPPTAQEKIAREPSVLEHFTVPGNFKYEEIWPKIYDEVRSEAPVLNALLLLGITLVAFPESPSDHEKQMLHCKL
jgi:hypothetical protein